MLENLERARDMITDVTAERSSFDARSKHAAAMVRGCLYVADPLAALRSHDASPIASVQERAWCTILLSVLEWSPVSPWVQRAIAGTLPASDRTGTVRA